mmetsp:Transcript_10683/g.30900  ORF Transcript_10683/g.30900 Transcript_10683/m.30900 type:complete len:173 (-) Transcript_10683:4930-5448(-)
MALVIALSCLLVIPSVFGYRLVPPATEPMSRKTPSLLRQLIRQSTSRRGLNVVMSVDTDAAYDLKQQLLKMVAAFDRGQAATKAQRADVAEVIGQLESLNDDTQPVGKLVEGTWRLVYSSDNPTRSSPLWWATRQLAGGIPDFIHNRELIESVYPLADFVPVVRTGERPSVA